MPLVESFEIATADRIAERSSTFERIRSIRMPRLLRRPRTRILGVSPNAEFLWNESRRPVTTDEIVEYRALNPILIEQGGMLTADGWAISETLADAQFSGWKHAERVGSAIRLNSNPVAVNEHGLLLKKQGQTNYGHWLVEILPKLYLHAWYDGTVPVIVHKPTRGFEWLTGMYEAGTNSIRPSTLVQVGAEPHQLEAVSIITGMSKLKSFFSPVVAEMAGHIRSSMQHPKKKLYVTRSPKLGRAIANAEEVEDFFLRRGFDIIEPSSLSFPEQVKAFSGAQEVFGIMGAAMCNTIFSPRSARIGYIAPDYMLGSFYMEMETALGRPWFEVLFCPSVDTQPITLRSNIRVDLSELEALYERQPS